MNYLYTAYHLQIQSNIPFPELTSSIKTTNINAYESIHIHLGAIPHPIPDLIPYGPYYAMSPHRCRLHIPHLATFLIEHGTHITIEPLHKPIELSNLRAFILGPCMAALLIQRDLCILRGIAIETQHHRIAIIGETEAHHTFLTKTCIELGYRILSDQMVVITPSLQTLPGYPYRHIWPTSRWKKFIYAQYYMRSRLAIDQYLVPLKNQQPLQAYSLQQILVFDSSYVTSSVLSGSKKIYALQKNIYLPTYVKGLNKNALYFDYFHQIASRIDLIGCEQSLLHPRAFKHFMRSFKERHHETG